MRVIPPIVITDAMLISSTAPETDHAAWNAGTAYAVGDRVIRTATHRRYERLVAGTTPTAPEADPVNWLDLGPTNRWAMLDASVSTATAQGSGPLTVVLAPGLCNSLALMELTGQQAQINVTDGPGGPTVYSRTVNLDRADINDWYAYFFEPNDQVAEVVLTDLPPYSAARITVSITGGGAVGCGLLAVGTAQVLGDTEFGASAGITDYSRKETNEFGQTVLVRRAYSRRMSARALLPTAQIARVQRVLAELRATPCVWVGSLDTDTFAPLVVWGFYRDFSINVAYPTRSHCTLDVEGLI